MMLKHLVCALFAPCLHLVCILFASCSHLTRKKKGKCVSFTSEIITDYFPRPRSDKKENRILLWFWSFCRIFKTFGTSIWDSEISHELDEFFIRKNQHAESKSNQNDAKIDAFSLKFQSIFIHKKIDTPNANASNIISKSMIFYLHG